jgi:muramoyltetrapeptide carboxypeptidase
MRWESLKRGDIVDIVAPASHAPHEKLQEGVDWLNSLGLIPRMSPRLIDPDLFFSSDLAGQLTQLKEAIHSDSKAIWCLRGGYGSMRLIPALMKLKAPKKPKLFVGFSDITSLHLFFNQRWNWPTIHGRTISQLSDKVPSADREELKKIIFGKLKSKTFKQLLPLNAEASKPGVIKGSVTGGNLRILQSSLGTQWELKAKNKILFMEDIAERGYSIDRMLEQLFQARLIDKGLKGLVFGDFTEGREKDGTDLTRVALARFAQRVNYPVFMGLPCGHGPEHNHALPFNTRCELKTGKRGQLTCDFGARY